MDRSYPLCPSRALPPVRHPSLPHRRWSHRPQTGCRLSLRSDCPLCPGRSGQCRSARPDPRRSQRRGSDRRRREELEHRLSSSPLFAARRASSCIVATVAVVSIVLLGLAADDSVLLDLLVAAIDTHHTLRGRAPRAELRSHGNAALHPIRPRPWIGAPCARVGSSPCSSNTTAAGAPARFATRASRPTAGRTSVRRAAA
jgi:hypothetical protein